MIQLHSAFSAEWKEQNFIHHKSHIVAIVFLKAVHLIYEGIALIMAGVIVYRGIFFTKILEDKWFKT